MRLKIGICDDDPYELKHIDKIVRKSLSVMGESAEIKLFQSSKRILDFIEQNTDSIDILFLDIYIDERVGFEIAEIIRKKKMTCSIVFMTAFMDPIQQSFRYLASGYLVKPVDEAAMSEVLEVALSHLHMEPSLYLSVKGNEYNIPYTSILCLENKARSVFIYCIDKEKIIIGNKTLSDFCELPEKYFYRCHKSFIVNFMHVVELDKSNHEFVLRDGKRIAISRTFYHEITQKFIQYHSVQRSENK